MSDLQAEFEQLFRDYEDTWNSQEYARLKEYWDEDDADPFYLAEEQDDWKFGWPAVEKYWEPMPGKSALCQTSSAASASNRVLKMEDVKNGPGHAAAPISIANIAISNIDKPMPP